MFVLDELDKLLDILGLRRKKRSNNARLKISLADIDRIDVRQLDLASKVQYTCGQLPTDLFVRESMIANYFDLSTILKRKYLTTDILFASLMKSVILTRLTKIPQRQYASAKLMICDRDSYAAIMKLQRILDQAKDNKLKNFIYHHPFNITAVFLLQEVIDMLDRAKKPIVFLKENPATGKQVCLYNYSNIKETFPFLKMSDLIIVLMEAQDLKLGAFNLKGKREDQILQYLSYFARSTHLIDLQSINKQIGQQHLIYNNVTIFWPNKLTPNENKKESPNIHLKPPLGHLSFLAYRLVQMAKELRLNLCSISYRAGDPNNFTKIFSKIIASEAKLKQQNISNEIFVPTKVIVLDRYFDIQSPLYHTDRYGAFIEQEIQAEHLNEPTIKMRLDLVDELDKMLQLEKLINVLGTILKYTVGLKPNEVSSGMSKSQSIRRHMDIVKIVYKSLNEGYLLILRLESSLKEIFSELKSLSAPLSLNQQDQLAERLIRIWAAFKQLTILSGKSIKVFDIIRVACILVDVINIFVYIHSKGGQLTKASRMVADMKTTLMSGKEFKSAIRSRLRLSDSGENDGDELRQSVESLSKLEMFDRISVATCGQRATLSLEEIIEKFVYNQLDQESYPSISLCSSSSLAADCRPTSDTVVLLVFLGSMSADELSRVKIVESTLKGRKNGDAGSLSGDIILLTCGVCMQEDLLS